MKNMVSKNYSYVVVVLLVSIIFWFYGLSNTQPFDYIVVLQYNNSSNNSQKIKVPNNELPTKWNEKEEVISYVISSDNELNLENKVTNFNGAMDFFSDYFYHPDACQRIADVAKKNNPSISVSAIQQRSQTRLGNQLSNFASGYAIWRDFGILNYMDPEQLKIIGKVFKLPTYEENDDNASYYVWLKGITNFTNFYLIKKNKTLTLNRYILFSYLFYFSGCLKFMDTIKWTT